MGTGMKGMSDTGSNASVERVKALLSRSGGYPRSASVVMSGTGRRLRKGQSYVRLGDLAAFENGEHVALSQKLGQTLTTLAEALAHLEEAFASYRAFAGEMVSVTGEYMRTYPDDDAVKQLADDAVQSLEIMRVKFSQLEEGQRSSVIMLMQVVRSYIAELRATQVDCAMVEEASDEFHRCKSHVESLEGKARRDPDALRRGRAALEDARQNYEGTVRVTVERQRELYPKRDNVFRAALTAYWLCQGLHLSSMEHSLRRTLKFANENKDKFLQLDLSKSRTQVPMTTSAPRRF
mmetsp:Transcript_8421/g.17121  ORF Transcript_8421/g.17121 Transcript_8421/m.17121 type:complete len:293 (-) Transcript_8421:649-1527(-)|eukprot:CAMPEP_0184686656 /NCGR_PEP_ID=MMETSP0312-20130426/23443_1 /TAXON_ID=31354 /ORGANISM="Compsopogon coeruleus, Strain SAG 36.94" /LENGTH=292 /DNA_ID=CAMNT_0027141987 /DNA_START=74 /DNA_END=952 /DNA_ORIENTATION=-